MERPEAEAAAFFSAGVAGKEVMPMTETIMLLALLVQVIHVVYVISQKK
ncbi:hypothetical protein C8P63_1466 [Melghirimyces profundicolus]|uniref:Uncharacterized protein n=1 Tax=Melghirimyces profundicolus TaxID=1242148 RepID=A0A2T6AWU5_9BACL|nr:hypothetical protein C8P63_1466 [Melghirimyces profundicolus]